MKGESEQQVATNTSAIPTQAGIQLRRVLGCDPAVRTARAYYLGIGAALMNEM
jgi:hypothetical protein